MKKHIVFAAVAGSASLAAAQNFSLSLVPSVSSTAQGGSFTLTVYGDADVGTHLLGGAFSIETNSACVEEMTWQAAAWSSFNTDGGHAGEGNYNEVIFGQFVLPPIFLPGAGSELGGAIGSFTIQLNNRSDVYEPIDFQLVAGTPYALETVDSMTGESFRSSDGTLALGSARVIGCFPTPGVCSVLGFGGLVASRRRRFS